MGILYTAVFAAVLGRKRRCPACGKEQIVDRLDHDGRYHCKKCGYRFTKQELATPQHTRH